MYAQSKSSVLDDHARRELTAFQCRWSTSISVKTSAQQGIERPHCADPLPQSQVHAGIFAALCISIPERLSNSFARSPQEEVMSALYFPHSLALLNKLAVCSEITIMSAIAKIGFPEQQSPASAPARKGRRLKSVANCVIFLGRAR
jgi:hypothetical protein